MLLFPAWLQHYIPSNDSNKNRISISFNIMLRGIIGKSTDYNSACID